MLNMFHFRSFFNFLGRNKLFTAINVFGFAVSLVFVILLGLYVQDELSVDSFHANRDRIYRVQYDEGATLSPAFAPTFAERYPEIESWTRIYGPEVSIIEPVAGFTDGKVDARTMYADSSFFTIFSFPLLEGDRSTVMRTRDEAVLSASFARKLFGGEPAVGKSFTTGGFTYVVSGVAADFEHTHFEPADLILRADNAFRWMGEDDCAESMTELNGGHDYGVYLMGRVNSDLAARLTPQEMDRCFKQDLRLGLFTNNEWHNPRIIPLDEVYLSPLAAHCTRSNNSTYLLMLGATALVILLFAVINYINLSVAQSGFRAQEAAMRRLLGGSRAQLFGNFVTESLLVCAFSFGMALLLAEAVEPWFRDLLQTQVSLAMGMTWKNVALAAGVVLGVGVLAGLTPAYVLTRFKPIDVVRGTFRRKTKMVYSRVLIVFQYVITIVLIGCTLTIIRQIGFMCHSDLGFDAAQVVACRNRCETAEQQDGVRGELMAIPGVAGVSFSSMAPGLGQASGWYFHDDIEGHNHDLWSYGVDTAYLSVMGIVPLRETGLRQPNGSRIWLNETAWKDLGLAPDATEYTRAEQERHKFRIAGLVPDFSTGNFAEKRYALLIEATPGARGRQIFIRVESSDPFAVRDRIGERYNKAFGGNYFDGQFLQQRVEDMYREQRRMSSMVGLFSLLAIVISALGMLAMSTYFMRQRAQEVAVRKVFGATDREVLTRLVMSFLRLVVIAFVVAVPVIWYLMSGWLGGYAYRIPLSWTIFALAGGAAFVIAFGTVLWQSLKATRANPILSIRD